MQPVRSAWKTRSGVIYHRSRVQQTTSGMGRMLAVSLTADEARELLVEREGVCIAAINGPTTVTLSGDPAPLEKLAAELETRGVFNTFLRVTVAYHSHQMEPLKDDLEQSLAGILPIDPALPICSTVSGRMEVGEYCDGPYWYRNIRNAVLFSDAMDTLVAGGHTLFLEIGPHPVLSAAMSDCLLRHGVNGSVVSSLRRKEPEGLFLARAVGQLYVAGFPVDWQRFRSSGSRYTKLPTYPWQRERYWIESERNINERKSEIVHPLLGVQAWAANTWECDLNFYYLNYLTDHIIDGVPLLPGAAYVEGGLAIRRLVAEGSTAIIEDLQLVEALSLQNQNEVRLEWAYSPKTGDYQVYSRELGDGSKWTLHASAHISGLEKAPVKHLDLDGIRGRCLEFIPGSELYPRMRAHGAHYAERFQALQDIRIGSNEVLARLALPVGNRTGSRYDSSYCLHPAMLDGSFQALIACLLDSGDSGGNVYVPVRIKQVQFHEGRGNPCWSWGRLTRISEKSIEGDIVLCNEAGEIVAEVEGLRCSALRSGKTDKVRQLQPWTYALAWEPAPAVEVPGEPSRWVVLSDSGGMGAALVKELRAAGASEVIEAAPGAALDRDHLESFLREAKVETCRGVVDLRVLDISNDAADPVGTAGTVEALRLAQALATSGASRSQPRLYFVTRGAQQVRVEETVSGFAQASAAGLTRVAASEYPSLRPTLIDIAPDEGTASSSYLAAELQGDSAEDEVALRGSERFVRRMVRASTAELEETAASSRLLPAADGHAFTLEIGKIGSLDSLRFRAIERRKPARGEVEIRIGMASLNFKDVLKVMGLLPEEAYEDTFFGLTLGMEAAGTITQIGEGVSGWRVGDKVVASLRSSFSSHVYASVDTLMARPQAGDMEAAEWAASPVVFITAWYALNEIARLAPGEKVLIHAAAGGVGLAAIQVARWLGAEVFATAGSPDKREYLRALGVEHIYDSRSLNFASEILADTNGYGVDVVLNSIAGETLRKSISLLAPFGRFVEIGKRDIIENGSLPMLPFNRSLSFTAFDLDRMMADKPNLCQRLMDAVWERLSAGDFQPPPVRIFRASEIADAFRFMAQSQQIGKVVIDMEAVAGVALQPLAETEKPLRADGTYLITGAFGGIGLEVARWAAAQEARHLVLVGRRGATSPLAKRTVEELEKKGVTVRALAADISQEPEVMRLLADIGATMPPLKGIFHAAAVIDDGFLGDLDGSRFETVMAPKALGAWYLHKHTRSQALDIFMLFSSVSAWVGNPGQANYVAANAFLDALAEHRRAQGLPAVSVSWGAVADVGMVAQNQVAAATLARAGIRPLPIASVTGALASLLRWSTGNLCLADIDWGKWSQFQPGVKDRPRYTHILAELETGGEGLDSHSIQVALAALAPEKRLERLSAAIAAIVADALHLTPDKLDTHASFNELGIDSLLGLELQSAMTAKLGLDVSLMELMKSKGIDGLARDLLVKMKISDSGDTAEDAGSSAPGTVKNDVAQAAHP